MRDKAKPEFLLADYIPYNPDLKEVSAKFYRYNPFEEFKPGRGVKEFRGTSDFKFYSILNKEKPDEDITANFCSAKTSFLYGKEKIKVDHIAYGPPQLVLDSVLNLMDKKYHEDIIDYFTARKLFHIEQSMDENPKEAFKKFQLGMKAMFEAFDRGQKITGKKYSEYLKDNNLDLTQSGQNFLHSKMDAIDAKQKKEKEKIIKDREDFIKKQKEELEEYIKNPFAFKSVATKKVVDEKLYNSAKPAEILTQKIALTNVSVPQIATATGFDISTVYHHIRGTREVSREAALRYASFFNCDPADILFAPIRIPVTGHCDILRSYKDLKPCEVEIKHHQRETVTVPRDFYTNAKDIKAIKINSSNSIYDNHVAYYYYTNKKEADCENKLCFIVVDNGLTILEGHQDYFIGIYAPYKGDVNILNPDPYRKDEVVLQNPKIKFITPIVAMVNLDKIKSDVAVEYNIQQLSLDQKLAKLEKDLEVAENQYWIMKQKQTAKGVKTPIGAGTALAKVYRELLDRRLEVDQMRREIAQRKMKDKFKDETVEDIQKRMLDFLNSEKEEDQKLA